MLIPAAALVAPGNAADAASASAAALSAVNSGGLQRLGACLAAGRTGSIVLVLDRSASLKDTDPGQARVDASEYLIDRLASYVEETGSHIDLAIAGFDATYTVTTPWQRLDAQNRREFTSDLEAYRDEDHGFETDYWAAVSGARETLVKHAGKESNGCSAMVWFSDGQYDLDVRDTDAERTDYGVRKPYASAPLITSGAVAQAENAGRTDLCRDGGVADQVRVSGIVTLTVGLKAPGTNPDFSFMRNVATGAGGCGAIDKPDPGEFYPANRVDELLLAFDRFSNPRSAPVSRTTQVCAGNVCPAGTHEFVLDASISTVHILGTSSAADPAVVLDGPGAHDTIEIDSPAAGTRALPGSRAKWSWLSGQALQIDLTRISDTSWSGKWRLVFIDRAATKTGGYAMSNIHLYGDLEPTFPGADTTLLRSGGQATVLFGLRRSDGGSVDPSSIVSDLDLSAELVAADGSTVPVVTGLTAAEIGKPQRVDLSNTTPGRATLQLKLQVTTVAEQNGRRVTGTALEPTEVTVPITVLAPADYPTVASEVDLGLIEDAKQLTAAIAATGSGCVWLADQTPVTSPDGVDTVAVSSTASDRDHCTSIDGEGQLEVAVKPSSTGYGLASGRLTVMTLPADRVGDPVPATVNYQLEMRPPVNMDRRAVVFVLVLLAGLLIPLLIAYFLKWRSTRIPGSSLLIASASAPLEAGQQFTAADALHVTAMRTATLSSSHGRRLPLPSGGELRPRMGWYITEPGHVVAAIPGRLSGALSPGAISKGRARLPLAVQNNWFVVLDANDPRHGAVEVVYLTSLDGSALPAIIADARQRASELVEELRRKVNEGRPSADGALPEDDWALDNWGASPRTQSHDARNDDW